MEERIIVKVTALSLIIISFLAITTFVENQQYEKEVQMIIEKDASTQNLKNLIEHKELKQNGYSIHYYLSGDTTNELIVFLHPAFADHRCFDKQIEYFSRYYRVITVDMLGHGASSVDKSKDKIDFTVNHIDSILQHEGYERAHFVGVSMGALMAQYFGLHHPEKVSSMSILGGYNINADNPEIAKAQRSENIKWLFRALFSMNSFRRYVSSAVVSKPVEQAHFYKMAGLYTRKSFTVMSGLGNVLKVREDVILNYPLLILSGDKDIELAKQMSKKWHDSEPASQYREIENAGHCANMDNPDVFNTVLMAFINEN